MSKSSEELFEKFVVIGHRARGLGGIVQNAEITVEQQELQEWNDEVNHLINDINNLKEDVIRYYQK